LEELKKKISVEIYTDGACKQNIGKGGWAFLILKDEIDIFDKSEPVSETTNNQCEMLAAINGLKELSNFFEDGEIKVKLFSDSAYLVNAFLDKWIENWMNNGWKNSNSHPVANKEYWLELIQFQKKYNVEFVQIKRVSNEHAKKVDGLAKKASNVKT